MPMQSIYHSTRFACGQHPRSILNRCSPQCPSDFAFGLSTSERFLSILVWCFLINTTCEYSEIPLSCSSRTLRTPVSGESCAEWPRAASVKRDHQAIVSINRHLSRVKLYAGLNLLTRSTLFRIHRTRFHLQASTHVIPVVEIFTSSGFAWVTFLVHGPRPPGNVSSCCELLPYVR
jgi:hypothetical protein